MSRRHPGGDMRRLTRIFAHLVIAVLSGCGGGDSGSGPPPLSITAASPPSGTSGVAYSGYTFAASGGTPPMTWSEAGPLPPGMTLSVAGLLSGSPARAGTYPIVINVVDSSEPPLTNSVSLSLKVNDSAIVISLPGTPSTGTPTYPYPSLTFNVSGGSPPYTFTSRG